MSASKRSHATRDADGTSGGRPRGYAPRHEAHVLDHLGVLSRYRYTVISVFLLIVLGAVLRTYTVTPLYQAAARLMIEMEDEQTAAIATALESKSSVFWQDPKIYYETQYRILTGAELTRRAVQRLDGSKEPDPARVDEFVSHVSVRPLTNSRLVDVCFVSPDAALAARAANAIADEYLEENLELRRRSLNANLEWLSVEVANQEKKIEASEQAMAQYREQHNAFSLEERQNIVVARLNQLNEAVMRAKAVRMQKAVLWDEVQSAGADGAGDAVPAIRQNPAVQAIRAHLADLQSEKTALLQRYGEKYPDVVKITASIQDAAERLQVEQGKAADAIKDEYEAALAEERGLTAALEAQKNEANDLSHKNAAYTVLQHDAQSDRQVYEALLMREKELRVMANSRGNNVRLIDRADVPTVPFTPTLRRDLTLGVIAGFVLSIGLVFFLNYLDDTVKTPDDVTDKLKVPLLGLAPKTAGGGHLLQSAEASPDVRESFRSVRTALSFLAGPEAGRRVIVTSARPLEGKTTTACNLAFTLATGGARVLLIDADMRRRGVHRALNISGRRGLSDVLTGRAPVGDALVGIPGQTVWVMPAGPAPHNPPDLLGSAQMQALLDEASGRFDWVVLDTPPVLAVTDAVVLTRVVDGIAFVIGSEMTRREHSARALEALVNGGRCWIGAVLNRVDSERNRYYYKRYCGGYHDDTYTGDAAHVA
ncbi:MAG TPA: polysaccharide biosynthesis tyrosine autokinase [Vicinamibacterales bacterium]